MTIQTGRNPFARHTVRKRLAPPGSVCAWCGTVNDRTRPDRPHGRLWHYYVDADNPRESGDLAGAFCNVSCLNAYRD